VHRDHAQHAVGRCAGAPAPPRSPPRGCLGRLLRCLAVLRAGAAVTDQPRRARPCERACAGKVIKACYGTTKYCNAFLKGVACNNSDCLYLHDVGALAARPAPTAAAHKRSVAASGMMQARWSGR